MAESNHELVESATLEAASAKSTSGSQMIADKKYVALYCKYTRGAAGGKVTIRVEYSFDGADASFYQKGIQGDPSIVSGSDEDILVQRKMYTYKSTDDPLETFIIWLTDKSNPEKINANSMRIVYNESGVGGSPGTFQCTLRIKD